MTDCIFCKIAKKEIPAEVVLEKERVMAFTDIRPKAPFHALIIPKEHIASVMDLDSSRPGLPGELVITAKEIAKLKNLEGYKLIFNVGRKGGQIVDHVHLHLLGGWNDKPSNIEV